MLLWRLDAFGNNPAIQCIRNLQDRTNESPLGAVLMDTLNEMAVDLDVIRPQFDPVPQPRIAGAQVIYRNAKTHIPIMSYRLAHQGIVFNRLLLGELDHHPARINAGNPQKLQGVVTAETRSSEYVCTDIEEEISFKPQRAERASRRFTGRELYLGQTARVAGGLKQRQRCVKRGPRRAANQGLVTGAS